MDKQKLRSYFKSQIVIVELIHTFDGKSEIIEVNLIIIKRVLVMIFYKMKMLSFKII